MVVLEIASNARGEWSGQLCEEETRAKIGERWTAPSRSELIAIVMRWVPLSHLLFRDVMDPLDP